MKALVTGGNGFLGRYIVEGLIAQGWQVRSLSRSESPDLARRGVEIVQGNLEDEQAVIKACENVDAVFHVAAKAGVWGNWASYYGPNVIGTRNVLKACQIKGVTKLVYTSTPSVVFNGKSFLGADETLPYGKKFLCHYAHTKAIAEKEVLQANSPTLRTVALRPHLIWGKGDPHLIPRIIEKAQQKRLCIVGDGRNKIDITHVQNAAYAHLLALDALDQGKCCGKAYFISQGQPVVLWDWINALLLRLHLRQLIPRFPLWILF